MKKLCLILSIFALLFGVFSCANEIDDAKTYLVFSQNSRALEKKAENLTKITLEGKSDFGKLERKWEKWADLSGEKIEIEAGLWELTLTAFLDEEKYSSTISLEIKAEQENYANFTFKSDVYSGNSTGGGEEKITISFKFNDKTLRSESVEKGKIVSAPAELDLTGLEFASDVEGLPVVWYDENNKKFDFTKPIEKSQTLYAKWAVALQTGSYINVLLKQLAGGYSSTTADTYNGTIKGFAKSKTKNESAENYLDTKEKILVWFADETIYYYNPGCYVMKLNEDSSELFNGMQCLESIELGDFDTSGVKNMYKMFYNCRVLTSLDLSSFDTSSVENMGKMFSNCDKLASFNVGEFDTSNVTDMSWMFYYCKALTSSGLSKILSKFDTSNVANMNKMFQDCSSLTELDLSNFNTSNVTDMSWMFTSCSSLTSLNLSNFDTSKVEDMNFMFSSSNLASLDLSNFDTSNVTNMEDMFYRCKFSTLDLSNFNTSSVTNMKSMFNECSNLTTIYAASGADWSVSETLTNSTGMFSGCTSLVGGYGNHYDENNVNADYAKVGDGGYFSVK